VASATTGCRSKKSKAPHTTWPSSAIHPSTGLTSANNVWATHRGCTRSTARIGQSSNVGKLLDDLNPSCARAPRCALSARQAAQPHRQTEASRSKVLKASEDLLYVAKSEFHGPRLAHPLGTRPNDQHAKYNAPPRWHPLQLSF